MGLSREIAVMAAQSAGQGVETSNQFYRTSCKSWLNMLQSLFIDGLPLIVIGFLAGNPLFRILFEGLFFFKT